MAAAVFYIDRSLYFWVKFLLSLLIKSEDLPMIKNYIYEMQLCLIRNIMATISALPLPYMFNMLTSPCNSDEKGIDIFILKDIANNAII